MIYTDATDQVLAVLDDFKIAAFENDEQYEALANAIRKAIAMHVRPGMADPLQDSGVQGLAQLGRNAIDRTSSLERTIATLQMRLRRAGQLLIEEIGACGPENADDTAERAAGVIRKQADAIATLSSQLGNLLAVIHRDGGHYEAEHGTEKASDDAITAVHVLRGSLEGYVEANKHMKGELDDALEDARKYAEAKGEIARLREALLGASCQVTDFWSKTLSDGNRRLQQMLLNLDPDRFSDEELQK